MAAAYAMKSQGSKLSVETSTGVWTQIKGIRNLSGFSAATNTIDATDLDSTRMEYVLGLPDDGELTMDYKIVPTDSAYLFLRDNLKGASAEGNFKVDLNVAGTPVSGAFTGLVTNLPFTLAVNTLVAGTATIRITGEIVWS